MVNFIHDWGSVGLVTSWLKFFGAAIIEMSLTKTSESILNNPCNLLRIARRYFVPSQSEYHPDIKRGPDAAHLK